MFKYAANWLSEPTLNQTHQQVLAYERKNTTTHLQLAPAARAVAAWISGAKSVGPEKYTAVTQSLYACGSDSSGSCSNSCVGCGERYKVQVEMSTWVGTAKIKQRDHHIIKQATVVLNELQPVTATHAHITNKELHRRTCRMPSTPCISRPPP